VVPSPSPEGDVGLAGVVGVIIGVGFLSEAGGCAPDVQAARDRVNSAKRTIIGVRFFITGNSFFFR